VTVTVSCLCYWYPCCMLSTSESC